MCVWGGVPVCVRVGVHNHGKIDTFQANDAED